MVLRVSLMPHAAFFMLAIEAANCGGTVVTLHR
jgi:hypothetical protein